jgi:hypothetical protein
MAHCSIGSFNFAFCLFSFGVYVFRMLTPWQTYTLKGFLPIP